MAHHTKGQTAARVATRTPMATRPPLRLLLAGATCLALALALALAGAVAGFPSGAPEDACKDLKPGHGVEATAGAAPFELAQDKLQAGASEQIKVTLSSPSKTTFKGLLVQATNEKGQPVGKFLPGKGLKTLDSCAAVTHADREPKKTATLVWEAPADWAARKEAVTFSASVVHKFDQFYTGIKSTLASSAAAGARRRRRVAHAA